MPKRVVKKKPAKRMTKKEGDAKLAKIYAKYGGKKKFGPWKRAKVAELGLVRKKKRKKPKK